MSVMTAQKIASEFRVDTIVDCTALDEFIGDELRQCLGMPRYEVKWHNGDEPEFLCAYHAQQFRAQQRKDSLMKGCTINPLD
jgi:hypothetical protein